MTLNSLLLTPTESEVTRVLVPLTAEEVEYVHRGAKDSSSLKALQHDIQRGQVGTDINAIATSKVTLS